MARPPHRSGSTRARVRVGILGVVIVVAVAACDSSGGSKATPSSSTTTTTTRPAVDGTPALGELAPLSGPVSAIMSSFTVPVQLAVDEMNAAGGIGGKPVALTVADDASSVPTARI